MPVAGALPWGVGRRGWIAGSLLLPGGKSHCPDVTLLPYKKYKLIDLAHMVQLSHIIMLSFCPWTVVGLDAAAQPH